MFHFYLHLSNWKRLMSASAAHTDRRSFDKPITDFYHALFTYLEI